MSASGTSEVTITKLPIQKLRSFSVERWFKNLSAFRWYYPFGALVAFVGFFTFLGIVWVGYMVYMSQCKSRASQSRQPSIYKANEGGDGVGTSNNGQYISLPLTPPPNVSARPNIMCYTLTYFN